MVHDFPLKESFVFTSFFTRLQLSVSDTVIQSVSFSLFHSVFVIQSLSFSLCHSVCVIQSASFSLCHSVSLSFSLSFCQYVSVTQVPCPCPSVPFFRSLFLFSKAFCEKMTIWLQRISAITDNKGQSLDFR